MFFVTNHIIIFYKSVKLVDARATKLILPSAELTVLIT